jgi:Xaa-Pro dipeptidase
MLWPDGRHCGGKREKMTKPKSRIERVREQMKRQGLMQLIVSDPVTIFYLTGVHIEPGERMLALLLAADGSMRLFVNRLFGTPDCGMPVTSFDDTDDGPALIAPYLEKEKALGIDKNWPARFLLRLQELPVAREFRVGSICCDAVRAVKDAAEQQVMIESSRVNDECMREFAALAKPGVTEAGVAEQILNIYKAHGCSRPSFAPIVAFGADAADPHHVNGDRPLVAGECVLLDVGGVYRDYCSDMTRTFFTAPPTAEQKLVYELVRRANAAAEAMVQPGVKMSELDAAARRIITEAGYGPYFNHRLGHFIGLEDHEYGDVSSACDWKAEPGMCFSIEPGIYLPGKFGVRIEDLILVTADGCRVLNAYPKQLTML